MLNLFDTAPVFTWAAKPLASAMPGKVIRISNVGPATVGSFWVSDGTRWTALNGSVVLARSGTAASAVGGTDGTSEKALATITVPAGVMGTNGLLEITTFWSMTSSANTKTGRVRFGGMGGTSFYSRAVTTQAGAQDMTFVRNKNAANSQIGHAAASGTFGSTSSAGTTASVDTSSDVTLVISGKVDNAADTITLEGYSVELIT